jgi:hypothetical protein
MPVVETCLGSLPEKLTRKSCFVELRVDFSSTASRPADFFMTAISIITDNECQTISFVDGQTRTRMEI